MCVPVVLAALVAAPVASAGQIVWSARNAIWAAGDDGTGRHLLVSGTDPRLTVALPGAVLSEPDVFQNGGTTVLFLGATNAFAPAGQPTACGQGCTDTYALRGGAITNLGPVPGADPSTAYHESQPRATADGRELLSWTLLTGLAGATIGSTQSELAVRPIPDPQDLGVAWSDTATESQPPAGFVGAPDPGDSTQAAWIASQGCGWTLNKQAACQYAVHVGTQTAVPAPISIYADDYAGAPGSGVGGGPTSLAWSTDGVNLLLVDPNAPSNGIYEFAAATPATPTKPVTQVLGQPAGWTFNQARFAGPSIIFDAHQGTGAGQTGDIFSIPATCTAATCSFPASATNLTNDPPANASNPAWTSASAPLVAFDGVLTNAPASSARLRGVSVSSPIRAGRSFTLTAVVSAPTTIVVKLARQLQGGATKTAGSITFACRSGRNRLKVGRIAGRWPAPGRYTATVRVKGSTAPATKLRFTVHA